MTDSDSNNENSMEDAPGEKLGVTLQRAREQKGLQIEDVAHRLNLNPQRIYDMENDDYRFSGAETYAKGYLRSYAKFLGLDPDLIIRDFDRLHYSSTIERHETKLLTKRQFSCGDRWMRWVTYSIGMILVFFVAVWWRSQPSHPATATLLAETNSQTTTDITAQATQKTESTTAAVNETQSDTASILPKSDAQPPSFESSLSQAQANPQEVGSEAAQQSTSAQQTSTDSAQKTNEQIAEKTTKSTAASPASSNAQDDVDDSDDEEDDESDDEDTEVSVNNPKTAKKHSWYQIKPFKPKVLVGQRGQDEKALLHELDKVFGRG